MTKYEVLMDRIKRTNDLALVMLNQIPEISVREAIDFDLEAKIEMESDRRIDVALKKRIIAATRLSQEEDWNNLSSAAMAYDRAGKFAEQMGLIEPAMICRIRACKIFNRLNYKEDSKEITFASTHLLKMATTYSSIEMKNGTPNPRDMRVPLYQEYQAFLD